MCRNSKSVVTIEKQSIIKKKVVTSACFPEALASDIIETQNGSALKVCMWGLSQRRVWPGFTMGKQNTNEFSPAILILSMVGSVRL